MASIKVLSSLCEKFGPSRRGLQKQTKYTNFLQFIFVHVPLYISVHIMRINVVHILRSLTWSLVAVEVLTRTAISKVHSLIQNKLILENVNKQNVNGIGRERGALESDLHASRIG
jgi:hypothetical protein